MLNYHPVEAADAAWAVPLLEIERLAELRVRLCHHFYVEPCLPHPHRPL